MPASSCSDRVPRAVGTGYDLTRHNMGFLVVDRLAEHWQLSFAKNRKLNGLVAAGVIGGCTVRVVKPSTLMNRSGECVKRVLQQLSLPPAAAIVVVDDISIPFGALRLRLSGSAGGHNGLKDIERVLGSRTYTRLRVGIGDGGGGGVVEHVLGQYSTQEQSMLPQVVDHVARRVEHWVQEDDVQKVISATNTRAAH
jgi:PTH1 family peptidyl-tRNA hydrolase